MYVLQSTPRCVFTGDHLFIGGTGIIYYIGIIVLLSGSLYDVSMLLFAGKMFECTAEKMLSSIRKITTLPHNSLLFPGINIHYSVSQCMLYVGQIYN